MQDAEAFRDEQQVPDRMEERDRALDGGCGHGLALDGSELVTQLGHALLELAGPRGSGIGGSFEHSELKISAGIDKGVLRYWSKKGFVQGPLGRLGNVGDFLLEVSNGPRANILFVVTAEPLHLGKPDSLFIATAVRTP